MLTKFTVLGKDIHTGQEYTGTLCTYEDVAEFDKRECKVYKDGQPEWLMLDVFEVLEAIQLG